MEGALLYRRASRVVRLGLVVFLLTAMPCLANEITYPVTVPAECAELAIREGFPLQMDRTDVERAKRRMHQLGNRDALVRQCRDAIKRIKAEME